MNGIAYRLNDLNSRPGSLASDPLLNENIIKLLKTA